MNWLREEGQWLLAGILGGAGCLAASLVVGALLAVFLFGVNVVPRPVPAPAASPMPVGTAPAATQPAVLPSPATAAPAVQPPVPGSGEPWGTIVYTCFRGGFDNICAIDLEDGEARMLTNDPATDFYPEISPRGDLITFSSRRSGEFRIYTMDLEGGNVRQVGPDTGSQFAPDISPDGTQIIFANAYRDPVSGERTQHIWVMNVNGSGARPLTGGPHNDVDPVWSPDGRQIAFSSDRGWRPAHWIMDADGQNMRMLPDEVSEHGGRSDWSPDAQWLAFYAGPRDSRDVYLVATDGSGESRRLTLSGRNLAPAYSPDGAWLVFTSYREGDNANLFIMRPDGTDVRQLTRDPRADWQPRWGP